MWNQKNISVLDGGSADQQNNSELDSPNNKKIFESSEAQDSGYLSGKLLSENIEEDSIRLSSNSNNSQNKFTEQNTFKDSGVITDNQDLTDSNNLSKNPKQSEMLIDSSIDIGLSEWFCGLDLKQSNQIVNNLNKSCPKPSLCSADKKRGSSLDTATLTDICYQIDDDGDTQLHLAIIGRFTQAIWAIIRLAPNASFLDLRNDDIQAPLHLAVLTGQSNVVRRLVVAGAKASIRDGNGNTPLHLACMNSDMDCVEALTMPVKAEEVKEVFKYSRTPGLAYQIPPDMEQINYNGEYCVHLAAQRNNINILRHLVWLGANINAREGKSGYTPLHFACENHNEELAKFLIKECSKLNVETLTYGRLTAYQLAAEHDNKNLMGNLRLCGAKLISPPQSDDDSSDDYSDNYEDDDFLQ